jgi:flagellar basal-body rod modification protein FlgD
MIGIKTGTQTWSNSPQRTDFKSDGTQSLSATDKQKMGGDEDIGDILNKVADPNYSDESKKMRTVGNKEMGKDAFMSLLLTQMKNQDPTNPLKSHEMAAQLAQFTSLEKLHNINDAIEGLRKDQQPDHNFQALNFIGRTVTADNSKVGRVDTAEHHDIRFTLPADGQNIKMQVKDAAGAIVRTVEFKNMKSGKNELSWNGMTDDGRAAPVGDYTVAIEATGSNGKKLNAELKSEGMITGVNFTPKGPQLMIGKQVVNMSDVKSISDPMVQQMQDMMTPKVPNTQPIGPGAAAPGAAPAQPKPMEVKPEHKDNSDKVAKMKKGDLNDASMAQGLINKLNKEGAKAGGFGG